MCIGLHLNLIAVDEACIVGVETIATKDFIGVDCF